MKTYHPPKSTIFLWQMRFVVMLTVLLALVSWIWYINSYFIIFAIVLSILCVTVTFLYLPLYFKRYSLTICDNAVIIKSGVFVRHERIMPSPRLIYTERYRTPVSRAFGVSGLVLRATRAATFTAELSDADITEILKEMSQ